MLPTNPKKTAVLQLLFLALLMALFLAWLYVRKAPSNDNDSLVFTATTTARVVSFPDVKIEAKAAYVYDSKLKKPLYAKDAYESLPLASLTKLMSSLVASELIPEYVSVRIAPEDIRQEGDTGLYVGERWNIRDLTDFTLITSSNDGIRAIAMEGGKEISSTSTDPLALFVDRMNETAKSLDLLDMHFYNQSGLDVSTTLSGGYGSARDMAMLVDYMLRHHSHLLEASRYDKTTISSDTAAHIAENTDAAIPYIPNLLASKTGYTDLAGGNVIAAFNAGLDHPIIVSVLGSTYEGRFADLETLVDATLVYLREKAASSTTPFK